MSVACITAGLHLLVFIMSTWRGVRAGGTDGVIFKLCWYPSEQSIVIRDRISDCLNFARDVFMGHMVKLKRREEIDYQFNTLDKRSSD